MFVIYRLLLSISFTFLIGSGLYFSIKLGFPQLRINSLFNGLKKDSNTTISPILIPVYKANKKICLYKQ